MSNKLEKLIAAYEADRTSLTAELEECLTEMEYGKAHLLYKGLMRINRLMQTLYNLRDKLHDEKEHKARSINFLKERVADADTDEYMRRYCTQQIAAEEERLAEISRSTAQRMPAGHAVRDMLRKLLAGEIAGFTLVFQASQRLSCHIKLVRKTLILTVPEIRRHRIDCTLGKRHIKSFKRLGFRLYDTKDKLMLFASYSTAEELAAAQRILARITFEVFYFKELAGETFIKYHP